MSEALSFSLLQIAQVLKSNGTDGTLLVSFRDFAPEDIDTQEPVFIYDDGLPVPFFIESFQKKGNNRALVHLTGIDSLEDAEEVAGRAIYGETDLYEIEEEDDLSAIVGWTLLDENGEKVGEITDFEPIPGNPCIYVKRDETEVMLPLHESLIIGMDEESATLKMKIPEGLLD